MTSATYICFNYIMGTPHLVFSKFCQNIYTATVRKNRQVTASMSEVNNIVRSGSFVSLQFVFFIFQCLCVCSCMCLKYNNNNNNNNGNIPRSSRLQLSSQSGNSCTHNYIVYIINALELHHLDYCMQNLYTHEKHFVTSTQGLCV